MRNRISQVFTASLLIGLATSASAAIINVAAGGNINAAITGATAGDEIVLADGTYNQDVVLNKQVTVRAANTGLATITGGSALGAIRVQVDGATLQGINVNGSAFIGIGIETSGTLNMIDVTVDGNGVSGTNNDDSTGLFANSGIGAFTLNTTSCDFTNNGGRGLTLAGGNTYVWNDTGSTISVNGEVGVLADGPLSIVFDGTDFSSNVASGIVSFYAVTGTYANGTVNSNGNRGFELLPTAGQENDIVFTNVDFIGNSAQGFILDQAGGASRPNQAIDFIDCDIQNNGGANPALFVGGAYTITGGTISGNGEGIGRFFWPDNGTTIDLDGVSITGNGGFGVRVDVAEQTDVTINNCTITGNGGEGPIQHFGSQPHTLVITDSILGIGTGSVTGVYIIGNGSVDMTNTVVDCSAATAAVEIRAITLASTVDGVASGTVDHCTLLGPGNSTVGWRGIEMKNDPNAQASGQDTVVTATNTIIANWGSGIQFFDDLDGVGNEAQPVFNGDNNLYFANAVNESPDDDSDSTGGPEGGVYNTTDTIAGDPNLNGSYVPQAPSAAIDASDSTSSVTTDVYGNARPGGASNDVGAAEAITSIGDWLILR